MPKTKNNIAIVGSTGSVGRTALKVILKYKNYFSVKYLAANNNYKIIKNQILRFNPKIVFVNNIKCREKLKKKFKKSKVIFLDVFFDKSIFDKEKIKFNKTILAIPSFEGLKYAFKFSEFSDELLIANKESIVCGGNILLKKAKSNNCKIISIDSEHYCINEVLKNTNVNLIDTVYITASGGPFLGKQQNSFKKSNIERATNHPNWIMGKKISVDSSTMVNKIFEIIEAHVLFKIPFSKIKIKIHKNSLTHCAILFKNGVVHLIAHDTTMLIPIRNTLLNNNILSKNFSFFKEKKNIKMNFNEFQLSQFKILSVANKVFTLGHAAWILFNVFNDLLVNKFLSNEIYYYEIQKNLIKLFSLKSVILLCKNKIKCESDIYQIIKFGNKLVNKL